MPKSNRPAPLIPPHPISKIHHRLLPKYEAIGDWIAQPKFNGQRNVIHVVDGKVYLYGRCHDTHKTYVITKELTNKLLELSNGQECVFDSELLHNKSSSIKNVIVIFDIFFFKKKLTQIKQEDRLVFLEELCKDKIPFTDGINMQNNNVYLSEKFYKDFSCFFQKIIGFDYLEGLILRKKDSMFDWKVTSNDVSWIIRVRKEHKNYCF